MRVATSIHPASEEVAEYPEVAAVAEQTREHGVKRERGNDYDAPRIFKRLCARGSVGRAVGPS